MVVCGMLPLLLFARAHRGQVDDRGAKLPLLVSVREEGGRIQVSGKM